MRKKLCVWFLDIGCNHAKEYDVFSMRNDLCTGEYISQQEDPFFHWEQWILRWELGQMRVLMAWQSLSFVDRSLTTDQSSEFVMIECLCRERVMIKVVQCIIVLHIRFYFFNDFLLIIYFTTDLLFYLEQIINFHQC